MKSSRGEFPIRRNDEGLDYCLLEDVDESVRPLIRGFAEMNLSLLDVDGKEAVSLETIVAYSHASQPLSWPIA